MAIALAVRPTVVPVSSDARQDLGCCLLFNFLNLAHVLKETACRNNNTEGGDTLTRLKGVKLF